jgi:hypothetical protein
MECDRVFFALTSGPFPSGRDSDAVVELHLLGCPACRRIAEALLPHDEQLHEALPTIDRRTLPRYSGGPRYRGSTFGGTMFSGVQRPVAAMSAVLQSARSPAEAAESNWSALSGWRRDRTAWTPESQVASYSLAPRRRSATAVEAISMLATLAGAAIAFWFLGVLAL